jgi:hypothetical protein
MFPGCWQDELIVKSGDKTERGIHPNDSLVKTEYVMISLFVKK